MSNLALSIVTPAGMVFNQQVDEVTVPGLLGEFGVLPGHVALIAATRPGVLSYKSGGERGRIAIDSGFAEVDGKGAVIVLGQQALRVNKIDRAAAEALLHDAEARLGGKSGDGRGEKVAKEPADRAAAESDRDWAQAQLDTLKS